MHMSFKYHQRAFSFQISHYLRNTILQWYSHKHVYMIRASFCFYYLNSFSLTQLAENSSYICPQLIIYNFSPIFWCKYNMILTFPPLCQVLDTFFLSESVFLRSRFLITLALHLFMVKFLHPET